MVSFCPESKDSPQILIVFYSSRESLAVIKLGYDDEVSRFEAGTRSEDL